MNTDSYEDIEVRRQRAVEEAAAWLVRMQDNSQTVAERGAFVDWLRESPLHVSAMLRISQSHSMLAAFDGWDQIPAEGAAIEDNVIDWPVRIEPQSATPPAQSHLRRRVVWGALAASLMVWIGMTLWWSGLVGGTVYQSVTGELRDVVLQDGSGLRLGPQSRVRVVFSYSERHVVLERGEAVFKVAKNLKRPFIVVADRTRVRAVGTEFGVEQRADTVLVTVAEGRVAVTKNMPSIFPFLDGQAEGSAVALAAGEQVRMPHSGPASLVRKVDSTRALGWENGRLAFDNESIQTIAELFNKYNQTRLVINDSALAQRHMSGVFDATDPESFVAFLKSSVPATIVRLHDGKEIQVNAGSP